MVYEELIKICTYNGENQYLKRGIKQVKLYNHWIEYEWWER